MAVFNDANLNKAYQDIYSQLQGSGGYTPLSMPEQTLDSITEQLAGALRPQFEKAIAQRYGATKEQKARIDVDAASRGMGSSTWVTDAKNRIMNAEAADIAGLESDYASQLAGDALNQYNNYLGDKLALDQYNQKLAQALGDDAYARTMQQLNAGLVSPVSKGGSGTKPTTGFWADGKLWKSEQEYLDWLKTQTSDEVPEITPATGRKVTYGEGSASVARADEYGNRPVGKYDAYNQKLYQTGSLVSSEPKTYKKVTKKTK